MARTGKIGLIVLMMMAFVFSVSASSPLPSSSGSLTLSCEFPAYYQIGVITSDKLYLPCRVSSNASCVSKVYAMDNTTHYNDVLQSNPMSNYRIGKEGTFKSVDGYVNAYFSPKNLIVGSNATFSVECSDGLGDYAVAYATVQPKTSDAVLSTPAILVSMKDNAAYYTMFFLMFFVIGGIILYGLRKMGVW